MTSNTEITDNNSFRFKKEERLCSKKTIDKLFTDGDSFIAYPLKIVYMQTDLNTNYPVQAAFTASKKIFKRAVKRNRIKRIMRESYRLNKHELYKFLNEQQLALFFIYIGKEIPEYRVIENATKKAIRIIQEHLNSNS